MILALTPKEAGEAEEAEEAEEASLYSNRQNG
jgi:hypothetical protein